MVEQLSHPTYKFVADNEADAFAWVFVNKTDPMKKVAIKFPELKSDELRVKVTYTGLCHSDLHTVKEEWGPVNYPIAPGHEIVGEVTHVGSAVTEFKVGDKVGFGCQRASCDKCDACTQNFEPLCSSVEDMYTYGDNFWGGYATSLQQPAKFYFKVPEGLPEEKIPPLFCAGITTYAPIARYAKPGQEVAVLGVGGLGHMAVQYAKAWGCNVTAFTSSKGKEEFIKKLGADRVVVADVENLKQEASKYHLVLNTLPNGDNMPYYIGLTRVLGHFVQLGLPAGGSTFDVPPSQLIMKNINVTGSAIGSRQDIKDMLAFSAKHNIVPICEQFDFENFPGAFDRLEHGRPIFRCVVDVTKAGPKH